MDVSGYLKMRRMAPPAELACQAELMESYGPPASGAPRPGRPRNPHPGLRRRVTPTSCGTPKQRPSDTASTSARFCSRWAGLVGGQEDTIVEISGPAGRPNGRCHRMGRPFGARRPVSPDRGRTPVAISTLVRSRLLNRGPWPDSYPGRSRSSGRSGPGSGPVLTMQVKAPR